MSLLPIQGSSYAASQSVTSIDTPPPAQPISPALAAIFSARNLGKTLLFGTKRVDPNEDTPPPKRARTEPRPSPHPEFHNKLEEIRKLCYAKGTVPTSLGLLTIERFLGEGAYCEVFLATRENGEQFALKVFREFIIQNDGRKPTKRTTPEMLAAQVRQYHLTKDSIPCAILMNNPSESEPFSLYQLAKPLTKEDLHNPEIFGQLKSLLRAAHEIGTTTGRPLDIKANNLGIVEDEEGKIIVLLDHLEEPNDEMWEANICQALRSYVDKLFTLPENEKPGLWNSLRPADCYQY